MATLQETLNKLRLLPELLARTAGEDAIAVANDIIAQSNLRRLERGEDSEGQKFSEYSPSYSKFRKKKGRPTDRKYYDFTGEMNASIHPEIKSQKPGEVTVTIKARGQDNIDKLRGAFSTEKRKRGVPDDQANILTPSETEISDAQAAFQQRRERRLNQILNG